MSVRTTLTITHGKETFNTVTARLLNPSSKPHQAAVRVSNFFDSINIGNRAASWTSQVDSGDAVAATGTITLSSTVAADTMTVGSQTFTCESSGATGNNQYNIGGTDTLTAAAAVAVINAHPSLSPYISASNVGAVITITSKIAGDVGNNIGLAISAHGSVSGAKLTGGTNATTYSATNTYHAGK